jgi:hypothetical protein
MLLLHLSIKFFRFLIFYTNVKLVKYLSLECRLTPNIVHDVANKTIKNKNIFNLNYFKVFGSYFVSISSCYFEVLDVLEVVVDYDAV